MINKANSGHPGMAIGSAPAMYELYTKHLRVNPVKPQWDNRDRFVLASGHISSLLYTVLHLSGFDLSMDDLKNFRQWMSKTPGHPEIHMTAGVDASSGPLGQGIPTAVGMAAAEKFLAGKYNREGFDIVDHYTYVLCGDGDMEEGVTAEASSLAGLWALGKLIVIYDANDVTLDGPLSWSMADNIKKKYEAMNWQVIEVADGNDINALRRAIRRGQREIFKPTLIIMKTIIGQGSANEGTSKVHGSPLGVEDGKHAKLSYGFDHEDFYVPEEVYDDFRRNVFNRGKRTYNKWVRLMKEYKKEYPEEYKEYTDAMEGHFHLNLDELRAQYDENSVEATRSTSEKAIQYAAAQNPTFLSGTADLACSTKTEIKGEAHFSPENYTGRNVFFGIREFAMVAIMNGMTLHKGIKISAGGFLVFSDYCKAAIRMSCMMGLPIIMPFSHDSIAVGEDGPTHQPIEQLAMLRSMVDLQVLRPADASELMACWEIVMETTSEPTALILTRQNVPNITNATKDNVLSGAYIVHHEEGELDGIIIATGSEVALAVAAAKKLAEDGHTGVRVVSMPSQKLFDAQNADYRESVLPNACRKRLVVEAGSEFGWHKYCGLDGKVLSVTTYGVSAPANRVFAEFGYTVENVIANYQSL